MADGWRHVAHVFAQVEALKEQLKAVEAGVDVARDKLKQATALSQLPEPDNPAPLDTDQEMADAGAVGGGTAGAHPSFELPAHLQEYKGDLSDVEAVADWETARAEAIRKLEKFKCVLCVRWEGMVLFAYLFFVFEWGQQREHSLQSMRRMPA